MAILNRTLPGMPARKLLPLLIIALMAACRPATPGAPTPTPGELASGELAPPAVITSTPLPPTPTPLISAQLLTRLGRGSPEMIAWAPDGRNLAVATTSGVYLFDGDTLAEVQTIGEEVWATSLAYSRDGTKLAIGGRDGSVRVWNFENQAFDRTLEGATGPVSSLSFSAEGDQLAIGRLDSTLWIWRLSDGLVRYRLRGHSDRITAVAFGVQPMGATPGGHMLASASRDGTVLAWNSGTGHSVALFNQHEGPVNTLLFAPLPPGVDAESEKLATAGADGTIRFWAPQNDILILTMYAFGPPGEVLPENTSIQALAFTSDGGLMVSGDNHGNIALWNGITGEPYRAFQAYRRRPVRQLAFRPGTTTLASLGEDGTVRFWNANPTVNLGEVEVEPIRTLDVFTGAVNDLDVDAVSGRLAAAYADGAVRLWDLHNGTLLATLRAHTGPVNAVAFNASGSQLASGGQDGSVRIWNLASLPPPNSPASLQPDPLQYSLLGHQNVILDVIFSRDGSRVFSGSADGTLRTWDPITGRPIDTLRTGRDWIESLAVNPTGSRLAVADERGVIQFWDTTSLVSPLSLPDVLSAHGQPLLALDYSPDGDLLVSGGEDALIDVWDTAQAERLRSLSGSTHRISGLDFDPTGQFLASGSSAGTVRIWSPDQESALFSFQEPWPLADVAFGHQLDTQDALLLTASSDGTIGIWSVSLPQ